MTNESLDEATYEEQAAEARKRQETERFLLDCQEAGWKWDCEDATKPQLVDPDDPEMSVGFDPFKYELLLSPKLVEQLKQMLPPKK